MNLLVLGRGKTGALVAEVGAERGHNVTVMGSAQNPHASGLTAESLAAIDVVIDFTTPQGALENIRACCRERKNMVVGTTGWHASLPEIKELVEQGGIGLVYGSNFSIGVNIFFGIARAAAAALARGYDVRIVERHHEQKKDAPSGTALVLRDCMQSKEDQNDPAKKIEITSIREGDAMGQHVILLDSHNDTMMLVHDAKSRRGFAEGAIAAAEWVKDKHGHHDFSETIE